MSVPPSFAKKKQSIVQQLTVPDAEYSDASPKGQVDCGIRDLIADINAIDGLVTTSSCAGRIAVFLEGRKKCTANGSNPLVEFEEQRTSLPIAGAGGKGGGKWLYVSHELFDMNSNTNQGHLHSLFGTKQVSSVTVKMDTETRYVHLKFEPMILHVLTSSLEHAQRVLASALSAGFRESGAINIASTGNESRTPMVAVRTTGLAFDSIVGYASTDEEIVSLVSEHYLETLVSVANERFKVNQERTSRFRAALVAAYPAPLEGNNISPATSMAEDWEHPVLRKQRKRDEGLKRQQDLKDLKKRAQQQREVVEIVHSEHEGVLEFFDDDVVGM
ncbi:hypothetical protein LTR66_007861 [Elasticomyces elasticus]|nr:hypothetical protein LTR66_007861 [Elasticomyces elasticus]KAK5011582.1 hypothetical protein LTR28_012692 [Elasticomyces elasticus]